MGREGGRVAAAGGTWCWAEGGLTACGAAGGGRATDAGVALTSRHANCRGHAA